MSAEVVRKLRGRVRQYAQHYDWLYSSSGAVSRDHEAWGRCCSACYSSCSYGPFRAHGDTSAASHLNASTVEAWTGTAPATHGSRPAARFRANVLWTLAGNTIYGFCQWAML